MVGDVGVGRGPGPGRARRRARAVAAVGRPGEAGRLADGHRQAPRRRRDPPPRHARAQAGADRARAGDRSQQLEQPDLAAAAEDVGDDVLAPRLHDLPPGAVQRGARGADPAPARRPDAPPRSPAPSSSPRARWRSASSRAKRTLVEARVPFEVPGEAERAERLAAVLEVIYLVFNEGYAATAGESWTRPGAVRGRAAAGPDPRRADAARAGGRTGCWR